MRGSVSLRLDTSFLWDIKRCSTNLYDVVTLVPSLLVLVTKSERRSRSDVLLWDSCAMRVWIWIMWILYIVCIPFMWSMFKIYHREDKKSDLTCHECQPCPPLTVSPGATTNKTLLTQINVAFSYKCTSAGCCWLVDRWMGPSQTVQHTDWYFTETVLTLLPFLPPLDPPPPTQIPKKCESNSTF